MPDGIRTLRELLWKWSDLAQLVTDAQAIEAIRAEVARLQEQIGRFEANKSGGQFQLDD